MDSIRQPLAALWLGALLFGAGACRQLPEDHYVQTWSRQVMTRWRKVDPDRLGLSLPRAARELRRTFANLSSMRRPALRDVPRAVGAVTERTLLDLRNLPRGLGARVTTAARAELTEFARGLRHERTVLGEVSRLAPPLQRFARGLRTAPSTLGLERRILPGPTDPERRTSILERPREETMGERLLRRLLR